MADFIIRPVTAADEPAWRALWSAYCTFYHADVPASATDATWARILEPASTVHAVVALGERGTVLGFANYVVHPYTWSTKPACYLEDLFVWPQARGHGTGRALIEHLLALARVEGWDRVYWMTREDNATARRLYDTFAQRDEFVRYVVTLDRD